MDFDFYSVQRLFTDHPAIRLLKADNAPFLVSFLYSFFVLPNRREASHFDLVSNLDDYLYHVNQICGEGTYPRQASAYIDEWSRDDRAYLRKFYRQGSDEPCYDLAPATEKVVIWIESLNRRNFVGTSSRLTMVVDLLKQVVMGATADRDERIAELEKKREEIDREIGALKSGKVSVMDGSHQREIYLQAESTARELLGDFREVEQNFRNLDHTIREKITSWEGSKSALLEEIFSDRDAILDSDQGKSFAAFWDFLMDSSAQEELGELLEKAVSLKEVADLPPDKRFRRIHFDWLEAGEHTQRTVAHLSQQLRRYLDNRVYLENRRVMNILDLIQKKALLLKGEKLPEPFMEMQGQRPNFFFPMERPLFQAKEKELIKSLTVEVDQKEVDLSSLYNQYYVDIEALRHNIRNMLNERKQVLLSAVVAAYPLTQGAAELVAYFDIASKDRQALFDENETDSVTWQDESGIIHRASFSRVIFSRL